MANIDVVDLSGNKVGSLELADEVFGPAQVNEALLWEAVKHYRAALRQGTAATKNRKLVSGAGKKLFRYFFLPAEAFFEAFNGSTVVAPLNPRRSRGGCFALVINT